MKQFPFGQPLKQVKQQSNDVKDVFVLGVYASAVHAKWIGPDGKIKVKALAVASEPEIFWKGNGVERIIEGIKVDPAVGKLVPADTQFNGPSGHALDDLILAPLGYKRENAWLCDLVPFSCVNPAQAEAIEREYSPITEKYNLPKASIETVPNILADDQRLLEIKQELTNSNAKKIILLGDQPIKWFLNKTTDLNVSSLREFVTKAGGYGNSIMCRIDNREYEVYALAHPRQVAKLGRSSAEWFKMHNEWQKKKTGN